MRTSVVGLHTCHSRLDYFRMGRLRLTKLTSAVSRFLVFCTEIPFLVSGSPREGCSWLSRR